MGEKAGKRGYSGNTTTLSWRRPVRQNGTISWENDALEGRNKGRRTEKMGRDGRKQESLTTGKLFPPYYIYCAGKAKVAVAGMSTSSCPLGGGPKTIAHPSGWSRDGFGTESRRPSFGMVSGRVRDGKPHTKKHISHASQATGPPHSNRLKSGVKNEVNFVAL